MYLKLFKTQICHYNLKITLFSGAYLDEPSAHLDKKIKLVRQVTHTPPCHGGLQEAILRFHKSLTDLKIPNSIKVQKLFVKIQLLCIF